MTKKKIKFKWTYRFIAYNYPIFTCIQTCHAITNLIVVKLLLLLAFVDTRTWSIRIPIRVSIQFRSKYSNWNEI